MDLLCLTVFSPPVGSVLKKQKHPVLNVKQIEMFLEWNTLLDFLSNFPACLKEKYLLVVSTMINCS